MVIIPANWIYDIDVHLEKFINNGLNSNQWFSCCYTTKPEAFTDNHPDKDFIPDYTLVLINEVNADERFDGVIFGLLVRFKRNGIQYPS